MSRSLRYEVWLDGVLGGQEAYFVALLGSGTTTHSQTSGGILSRNASADTYLYTDPPPVPETLALQNPNVIPAEKTTGLLGWTPTVSGGVLVGADPWVNAGNMRGSEPDEFGVITLYNTTVRLFLRTFTLKQQWSDGAGGTVALKGRWTGMGQMEWRGEGDTTPYPWAPNRGTVAFAADDWKQYQLTDETGVATYVALVGISIGTQDPDTGVWSWEEHSPPVLSVAGTTIYTGNVCMSVSESEAHPYTALDAPTINPWGVGYDYTYQQWIDLGGGVWGEKTSGWSIDYGSAWDGSGTLSYGAASLATHSYEQAVKVVVWDTATNTAVPCTVTVGGYTGTGGDIVLGSVVATPIAALPKGSLIDGLRAHPGDEITPPSTLTSLPLLDASGYPTASTPGQEDEIIFIHDLPSGDVPSGGHEAALHRWQEGSKGIRLVHSGKSGNSLTGISAFDFDLGTFYYGDPPSYTAETIKRNRFDGGEVVTQFYDGTWTETGGAGRNGTFKVWVHEDYTEVVLVDLVAEPSIGSVDWTLAPDGVPWLTEARSADVRQWLSDDCEATFSHPVILSDALSCVSRQVRPDHAHLVAAIAGGDVVLYTSKDTDTWPASVVVDNDQAYAACLLRYDPAGTLYLWFVDGDGVVRRRVSTDHGASWEARTLVPGMPILRPERFDARFCSERWYSLLPVGDGSLKLYSSKQGGSWALETAVASAGRSPWLMHLGGADLLAIYHDGDGWLSRRLSRDAGGTWTVGAAVAVRSGENHSLAGIHNSQKSVAAIPDASATDGIAFRRSKSDGDGWEDGSEG